MFFIQMSIQNDVLKFDADGFLCIESIYNHEEVEELIGIINRADQSKSTFRKTKDLFAVRQFLKEVPEARAVIFNDKLIRLLTLMFGEGYFVSKSIYFDKPGQSNWFVAYHQDLTISVDKRALYDGFGPWTVKHNQFAVQPPVTILQDNFTVRIHLDETTVENGALKVLSGSHRQGIRRVEQINLDAEQQVTCDVNKGGVMLMRPLLFHASERTVNNSQRRVIHVEFSKSQLPEGLNWSEKQQLN
jgi:ectoine hydroxylase-related dioxygenase (phytanoyl-CoA dioxygenase family)